jgi:hypothetical protein
MALNMAFAAVYESPTPKANANNTVENTINPTNKPLNGLSTAVDYRPPVHADTEN